MKPQTDESTISEILDHPAFTVSAARERLPNLVLGIDENPSRVIRVTRRKHRAALLVSDVRYGAVIEGIENGQLKPALATMVANKWLGSNDAPQHLYQPQIDELMKMTEDQLLQLKSADLLINPETLIKKGGFEKRLIERLLKRRKICLDIAEAHMEDVYDVSEHLSGSEGD